MALMSGLLDKFGPDEDHEDDQKKRIGIALVIYRMSVNDGVAMPIVVGSSTPYLFIGSIGSAYNLKGLKDAGITHIICLCEAAKLSYPNDFKYMRCILSDDGSTLAQEQFKSCLEPCLQLIQSASHDPSSRILIHCFQGKSRSAAVCVGHLMARYSLSYIEALQIVQTARPIALPNPAFALLLQEPVTQQAPQQSNRVQNSILF